MDFHQHWWWNNLIYTNYSVIKACAQIDKQFKRINLSKYLLVLQRTGFKNLS